MRRELEAVPLRRMARKPTTILSDQFQPLYQKFEKISAEAFAKIKPSAKLAAAAADLNGDLVKNVTDVSQSSSDAALHQNGDDGPKEVVAAGGAGVVVLD
jgi:hypothetical protein